MIQVFALADQRGCDIVEEIKDILPANEPIISNEALKRTKFADGEIEIQFTKSVRGNDVFLICSTNKPESIMELLLACNAAHYASARSVTAVIPYFGYARQDRKSVPRVSMGARLMADILQAAGVTRVITMDLHAAQEQAFFHIPVDHVRATSIFLPALKHRDLKDAVIVAPDAGAAKNAEIYAKTLNLPLVMCHKHRTGPNQVSELTVIGDVTDKVCYLIDDMIDTAGTICKCANALKDAGASSIVAVCTHALLSGPAIQRMSNAPIDRLMCTDTYPCAESVSDMIVEKFSVARLFAEVIVAAYHNRSIEDLYAVSQH